MSNLGPYFQCYASDWIDGIALMDDRPAIAYMRLVFRMYDEAGPIDLSEKDLCRFLNLNRRGLTTVLSELVELGKIEQSDDGTIINRRAMRHMMEKCIERHGKHNEPDSDVIQRLGKVCSKFGQSLGKVCSKFEETYAEKLNKNNDAKKQPEPEPEPIEDKEDKSSSSSSEDEEKLFNQFWDAYPRTEGQNRKLASDAFAELTPSDQSRAVGSITAYRKTLAKSKAKPWLPVVFLRDRVFETLPVVGERKMHVVIRGSPEHTAWLAHRKAQGIAFNPDKLTVPTKFPEIET